MPTLVDLLGGCLPGACGNNPPAPVPSELLNAALALLICGCVLLAAAVVFALALRGSLGRKLWSSKRIILSTLLGFLALLLAYRAQGAYEYFAHTPGAWPSPNDYPPGSMPTPAAASGYWLAAMLMVVLAAVMALIACMTIVDALRLSRRAART